MQSLSNQNKKGRETPNLANTLAHSRQQIQIKGLNHSTLQKTCSTAALTVANLR
jgi:hypothetical protein